MTQVNPAILASSNVERSIVRTDSAHLPEAIEFDKATDLLVYSYDTSSRRPRVTREALIEFTRLYDSPAEEIESFARRYGVLGLCEHGLPSTHEIRLMRAGGVGDPTLAIKVAIEKAIPSF